MEASGQETVLNDGLQSGVVLGYTQSRGSAKADKCIDIVDKDLPFLWNKKDRKLTTTYPEISLAFSPEKRLEDLPVRLVLSCNGWSVSCADLG